MRGRRKQTFEHVRWDPERPPQPSSARVAPGLLVARRTRRQFPFRSPLGVGHSGGRHVENSSTSVRAKSRREGCNPLAVKAGRLVQAPRGFRLSSSHLPASTCHTGMPDHLKHQAVRLSAVLHVAAPVLRSPT